MLRNSKNRRNFKKNAAIIGWCATSSLFLAGPAWGTGTFQFWVGPGYPTASSASWNTSSYWDTQFGSEGIPSDDWVELTDSNPAPIPKVTLSYLQTLDNNFSVRYIDIATAYFYVLSGAHGSGGTSHTLTLTGSGTGTVSVITLEAGSLTGDSSTTYTASGATFYLGYRGVTSNVSLQTPSALANINLGYSGTKIVNVGQSASNLTLAMTSNVSGTGGIEKNGNGTLILEWADGVAINNTFAGDFKLDSGTVLVGQNSDLFDSNVSLRHGAMGLGNITISSGSLGSADSSTYTIQNNVSVTGSFTSNSPNAGGIVLSGNVSLGSATPTITVTKPLSISGNITSSGAGLGMAGTGTLTLSGTNSFSGGLYVQSGTVVLGSSGALPTGATVTLGNGTGSGTLDLHGQSVTVGGLATSGTGTIGSSSITSGSTLTFTGGTSNFGGTIQDTLGGGNQTVGLVISSGNLTLSGNNSYSGGTILNNGTLAVANTAGSATGTGNITLNGGTLLGNGTISGTVLGGSGNHTINPGTVGTVGTLTLGGLSTNSCTTLAFDLGSPKASGNASVSDVLVITGNGTLALGGGSLSITSNPVGAASLGYYTAIEYTGNFTGSVSGITLPAISSSNVTYTLEATMFANEIDIHRGFLGDANDDGSVDLSDLNIVLNNLGTTTTWWTLGNFDGAPTIDLTDLNDVLNHLGTSIPTAAAVVVGNYHGVNVNQRIEKLEALVWTLRDPLTSDEITEIQNYAESLGLFAPITADAPSAEPALAADFKGIPDFQAVPEPASLAVLVPAMGIILRRRKRSDI